MFLINSIFVTNLHVCCCPCTAPGGQDAHESQLSGLQAESGCGGVGTRARASFVMLLTERFNPKVHGGGLMLALQFSRGLLFGVFCCFVFAIDFAVNVALIHL